MYKCKNCGYEFETLMTGIGHLSGYGFCPRCQDSDFEEMEKCEICGKDVSFGIKVSHSHRRTNRTWKPNIRRVKALVNGTPKRVYACTRCLRSGKVTRAI